MQIYSANDYNEPEEGYNWYMVENGLKTYWIRKNYDNYKPLTQQNGIADGIITNWDDYISINSIPFTKNSIRQSSNTSVKNGILSFEENYLFTKQEFEEITQSNPSLKYKTLVTIYDPVSEITEMKILVSYYNPYVDTDRNGAKIIKTSSSLTMNMHSPYFSSTYAPYGRTSAVTFSFAKGVEVNLYPIMTEQ